ncbi:MAG: endonuclease/exonuclease/phosphatase family protein, partial [Candidatus Thiodiazotropha endolucinida]
MSSSAYLCDTLSTKNIDICGVAEHWLYEKDLIFLDQINSNYNCHAVSDFDLRFPGRRRVGKGGVALLWHKRFDHKITRLSFEDDRIIGLQLEISPFVY